MNKPEDPTTVTPSSPSLLRAGDAIRDSLDRYWIQPVTFVGALVLAVWRWCSGRGQMRSDDVTRVLADTSARSLPIVLIVNVLVGAILAFVGAVQLVKFGAGIYVADLVSISVVREMAAVITAVVMAGRTGAAFAAELGTLQANEELDAFEVLGLRTIDHLILPRVGSLMFMLPLHYVFGAAAGLAGGLMVSTGMLGISSVAFLERVNDTLTWPHAALGFGKSIVFGALISLTACYQGTQAPRNAAGVGSAATQAVVIGIVAIIAADAVFAICANALGI